MPRQGRNYLTVAHPDTGQRLRLKGTLYEQDFEAGEYRGRLEREGGADQAALAGYYRQAQDEAKKQLRALGESLTRYAVYELTQTASAMRRQAGRLIAALGLRSLVIGLGVCMGIWSSLWAVEQWQHRQFKENIQLLVRSEQRIEENRQTLREIEQQIGEGRQTLRELSQEVE